MPYWMENPEHGVMPVYDIGDVERNKVHGWVLLNEGESPLRVKDFSPATLIPAEVLKASHDAGEPLPIAAVARKKPGPKPKAK